MSSAPVFTHPRFVEVAGYLQAARDEVIDAARAIPEARWSDSPAPDAWSGGQLLEHLRVVEHGVLRLMQKLLAGNPAERIPAEPETSSVLDAAFIARTTDRSRRLEAPARVTPAQAPGRDAGITALGVERAHLLAAIAPADGLAIGTLRWMHPVLGELDLYRWLVFVGAHERRHAAQLREIARALSAD